MNNFPGRRSHRSAAQWQALFERFRTSGQSAAAFCQSESISPSNFYRWRQKLDRDRIAPVAAPSPTPAFIDAGALAGESQGCTSPQTQVHAAPWDIELDLGPGMVLHATSGADYFLTNAVRT